MPNCIHCNHPLSDSDKLSIERGFDPSCWNAMQLKIATVPDDTTYVDYKGDDIAIIRLADGSKLTNVPRVYVNHSPTGFDWGYGGSGPADFAFNILLLFTTAYVAQRLYHDFKWEYLAPLPDKGGIIPAADIRTWVAARLTAANKLGATDASDASIKQLTAVQLIEAISSTLRSKGAVREFYLDLPGQRTTTTAPGFDEPEEVDYLFVNENDGFARLFDQNDAGHHLGAQSVELLRLILANVQAATKPDGHSLLED